MIQDDKVVDVEKKISKAKLIEIANLELDCKIGKDRHFIAANRKNSWRLALGLFSVIGSAIMASESGSALAKLIEVCFSEWKFTGDIVKFLGTLLPLLVGISTAIIGFLGLEKQTAQHRFVGNAYIEIARKARALINDIAAGGGGAEAFLKEYNDLLARYLEINKEGEGCPTDDKDSAKAMQMNKRRRGAVKAKLQQFDTVTLELKEKPEISKMTLWQAIKRGFAYRTANILLFTKIIRLSDYRRFARSL